LKRLLNDPKVIFVLGGPASGKGTQCEKIVEEFGFTHLSTGDLFRAELKKDNEQTREIKKIMDEGKLVPPEFTVDVLVNAMIASPAKTGVYLVDGFPREIAQATMFEKKVCEVHQVLFYDVPQDVMEARCMKRAETSGRSDDNAETIKKRVQTYFDQSLPVVDFYKQFGKVNHINAMASISDVYKCTKDAILP
jgi:adenylate kinase